MNGVFDEQILAEKLAKLSNTQQCIETLSHWCIFHRSKAEQVVATWDKQFRIAGMVEKVPLLYLANDILQNSKRKGNEFVSEFWKVLPTALKEVVEKGDDRGKTVVSRLVDIWEGRRVFGSCAQSLKDLMLGKESPAPLEFKRKRGRSVKIFKRDSRSVRTKLTIGGTPEKIVTAFHLVLSDHRNEDEEMTKCKSAIHRLRKMEEEVDSSLNRKKDPKRKTLAKQVEEEVVILKQAVEKLKVVEANRVALVSQLREALHEQESELENVRTQMQVAQAQAEEACTTRRHLEDENFVPVPTPSGAPASSTNPTPKAGESTKKTTAAIAAEVADMLTASSSSQYIMSSVLSTFAAEEAKSAGLAKSSAAGTSSSMPNNFVSTSQLSSEQMVVDPNVLFAENKPLSQNNVYQMPSASVNGHMLNSQTSYYSLPNPTSQHYLQASGAVITSYGYANPPRMPSAPPPPTPPSYMVSPMVPLTQQSLQITQQPPFNIGNQLSMLNQQQLGLVPPQLLMPSFRSLSPMPPPRMVYYTHPHQSQ